MCAPCMQTHTQVTFICVEVRGQLEEVDSLLHHIGLVGPEDGTQVVWLGGKSLCQLSYAIGKVLFVLFCVLIKNCISRSLGLWSFLIDNGRHWLYSFN